MAIVSFSTTEKTAHNSHKFGFTLSPTSYGFWKIMLEPFLVTNSLFGYVNGTIPCPPQHLTTINNKGCSQPKDDDPPRVNPEYTIWVANDAHVRMLIISTISEASFQHVQGTTSRDVWLSLERAYAPHTSFREYTLKTQLLKIEMKSDESSTTYVNRAKEYSDALANIGESMKEKDFIMLVVSGLRDECNTFKSMFLTRPPLQFSELYGLLSDHDYMLKKNQPDVTPVQAFSAIATNRNNSTPAASFDQITALQQLLSQFGLQVQLQTGAPASAFYANRGGGRAGRGNRNQNRCNSNGFSNRSQSNGGDVSGKKRRRATTKDIASLGLEDLAKYFDLPIIEASKNLKVGLTVLKKKCREFGIPRWPHRKIKSLDGLISDLQEEVKRQKEEDMDAALAVAKKQKMLESERERIEKKPFMDIQRETKKFRQDIFKKRHRARALENQCRTLPLF